MASQGPNGAGSGTSTQGLWSNPQNITADNGNFASEGLSFGQASDDLQATGFGFSVPPTATINGILVEIKRQALGTIVDHDVTLLKAGTATGSNLAQGGNWPSSPLTFASYGGSTNLWGTSWAPSDINASNFGVQLSALNTNSTGFGTPEVGFIRITVFFTVPAPGVTSCSPNSGPTPGGTSVTITGSNFLATPTSITFGGAAATNIVFNSATSVSCTTPAHAAGTVNVVVTNPDGQTGTGTNVFTFNPLPTVTSCNPPAGPPSGGNSVTITGTGFLATPTSITFGGAAATNIIFNSATSVSCTAPAHAAGTVNVVVTNPDGQSGTGTNVYTYNPPPSFSSCNPGNGPAAGGTSVTISGANFVAVPGVTFGGVAASNVTFVSSTSLTCTTPVHSPVTVDIVVTNPDGQSATGSKVFLYLATGSRFLSF